MSDENGCENVEEISSTEIVEFLKDGGLKKIAGGGSPRDRVWIYKKANGDLGYRFVDDDGSVGGHPVPRHLLCGGKVLEGTESCVKEFIQGFGLSDEDIEKVIDTIGKARDPDDDPDVKKTTVE